MNMMKQNCLSWWFPRLSEAGLPVPRTTILRVEDYCPKNLYMLLDNIDPEGIEDLVRAAGDAADEYGYPSFIRTGQFSGKHEFDRCCRLECRESTKDRIAFLVYMSHMVDPLGLRHDVIAVREWLHGPIEWLHEDWCNMPVRREFRCFVEGSEVVCIHPYWPEKALGELFSDEPPKLSAERAEKLENMNTLGDDEDEVRGLASRAGEVLAGRFSVDVLMADNGWYITDCAHAGWSYHWEGCEEAARFADQKRSLV